jgi:hypothetical protein
MARAPWLLAALGPLAAACVAGPPLETVREVAAPPAVVEERVADGFRRLGLEAPSPKGDGSLGATLGHARTDWARCRPRLVSSGDGARRMATAGRRHGEVTVALAEVPAGTRVEVRTSYIGVYRNTATGYQFETPCESTGAVEEGLLAAAGGQG